MCKTLFLLISVTFMSFHLNAQKEIDGTVSAGDSVNIIVKSVTPTNAPEIEVLFKAEDIQGYPYWGLEKNQLIVREGLIQCQVISLKHFTDQAPINIVLVLDHSGSMSRDYSEVWSGFSPEEMREEGFYESIDWESPEILKLSTFPLQDAKASISKFIPNFDTKKDKIGLVAFDHEITINLPVGTPVNEIQNRLKSVETRGGTAFYDAVQRGIENLDDQEGINVVIALTDGQDGSSTLTPDDIIQTAKKSGVLVYCIGLGGADAYVLNKITSETDGYYAKATNSSSLDSVYQVLERKLRSYYLLTYASENWSSEDLDRGFTLRFKVQEEYEENMPAEVIKYLNEESSKTDYSYALYGGGGVVFVSMLALGVWYFRKKRKKKLIIERTYPNPGNGHITLTVKLPSEITSATVQLFAHNGSLVLESEIQNGENKLDISAEARGFYEIILTHPDAKPAQRKYLKNV